MYVPSLVEQIQMGNGLVPLKGFAVVRELSVMLRHSCRAAASLMSVHDSRASLPPSPAQGNGIIGHGDTFPNENGIHYELLHHHAFISEPQWEAIEAE